MVEKLSNEDKEAIDNRIDTLEKLNDNLLPYEEGEYVYDKDEFSDEDECPVNSYLISPTFDREELSDIRDEISDDIDELISIKENEALLEDTQSLATLVNKQYTINSGEIEEPIGIDENCESHSYDENQILYISPLKN